MIDLCGVLVMHIIKQIGGHTLTHSGTHIILPTRVCGYLVHTVVHNTQLEVESHKALRGRGRRRTVDLVNTEDHFKCYDVNIILFPRKPHQRLSGSWAEASPAEDPAWCRCDVCVI